MNRSFSLAKGIALGVLVLPALAQAQYMRPIAVHPGDYQMIDRARIETQRMDWSKLQQQEDQQYYSAITKDAYDAYAGVFGSCDMKANIDSCGGLQLLKRLSLESSLLKKRIITADEIVAAIVNYTNARDLFAQKIAALKAEYDAWKGFANQKSVPAQGDVYRKGLLNLDSFVKTYEAAINKMDLEAAALTYRYNSNAGVVTTEANKGLMLPTVQKTPEMIEEEIKIAKQNMAFSDRDKESVGRLSRAISQQMLSFTDTNGQRAYWFNKLQSADGQEWLNGIQTKAKVMKWVRAAYCMPLGTPGLALKKPSSFNLDYLIRGVDKDNFRIADQTEWNERAIRTTLSRFDQLFVSLRSQSGEYNSEGSIMKFFNRVNSTLTWHNEVSAYLSIMKILRDNMVDEIDLISEGSAGCDKVRARYYAQYKTLKDPAFTRVVKEFLEGRSFVTDSGREAISRAGAVILSKASYASELRKLEKENIGNSVFDKLMGDLGDDIH